jgi:hypothetical protein
MKKQAHLFSQCSWLRKAPRNHRATMIFRRWLRNGCARLRSIKTAVARWLRVVALTERNHRNRPCKGTVTVALSRFEKEAVNEQTKI